MTGVFWTEAAQADLANIEASYAEHDPDHAARIGRAALAASRILIDYPAAGTPLDGGIRKWSVRETRHVLLYRIVGSTVQIVRMHHVREDWWKRTP